MKILVYGAGVTGSLYAARLSDAGHDVSLLARGARLSSLREHGLQLAEEGSSQVRRLTVSVVDNTADEYDLTLVLVRAQQVDDVLESLAGRSGDVLFLLNWAGGIEPLAAALGRERLLLGFPILGGTMRGDLVSYRADSLLTNLVAMPIGEPDGRSTPRLASTIELFRAAGIKAKSEPRMDAWLTTHAAFEVPLGQAVHTAGGLEQLALDTEALRAMVRSMKHSLGSTPSQPVPRAFGILRTAPESLLILLFRRFLRTTAATPLVTATPAAIGELERLAEQLAERTPTIARS